MSRALVVALMLSGSSLAHADLIPTNPCEGKTAGEPCSEHGDGVCEEVVIPNRGRIKLAKEPGTRVVCKVEKRARKSNKAAFIAIGCALGAVAIAMIASRGKTKPADPGAPPASGEPPKA